MARVLSIKHTYNVQICIPEYDLVEYTMEMQPREKEEHSLSFLFDTTSILSR